jgi:hypothetical protein
LWARRAGVGVEMTGAEVFGPQVFSNQNHRHDKPDTCSEHGKEKGQFKRHDIVYRRSPINPYFSNLD